MCSSRVAYDVIKVMYRYEDRIMNQTCWTIQNLPPLFLINASVNALYVWTHPLVDISPSVAPPHIVPPSPMKDTGVPCSMSNAMNKAAPANDVEQQSSPGIITIGQLYSLTKLRTPPWGVADNHAVIIDDKTVVKTPV